MAWAIPERTRSRISSLELGHAADDAEHETALGSAQIEGVAQADESHAIGIEFSQGVYQVLEGAAEAVDFPVEDGVALSWAAAMSLFNCGRVSLEPLTP